MEDSQIVCLYLERDEQAITETANKYASYCHSIAYRILNNHSDAEEVVQDTYMGAWNSIPPHKPAILSTYLGKISRRLSLVRWNRDHTQKRGGGQPQLALEELAECIPSRMSMESNMERREITRCLNTFLRSLPEIQQRVFICRYWHLYSIEEIAVMFGFSESKVKSMLSRSRNKLRSQLEKEGIHL